MGQGERRQKRRFRTSPGVSDSREISTQLSDKRFRAVLCRAVPLDGSGRKGVLVQTFVAYYRVSTDKQGLKGLGMDAQRGSRGPLHGRQG